MRHTQTLGANVGDQRASRKSQTSCMLFISHRDILHLGLSSILKDRKKEPLMSRRHVKSGFTTDLLLSLLRHERVKETHVKVLFEIPVHRANPPIFNGSKVPVSLLIRNRITHTNILNTLFDCGMTARETDVRLAVETLAGDSGTVAFEILCSHVQEDVALDGIGVVALKNKKVRFILCLARRGYRLPCSSQEVLALALEKNLADVAESLLPFCTLPEVDLGGLMRSSKHLTNHHQLIVKMVDGGVNPCGLGDNKPLAETMKMTNVAKKVDLVCILLERGCDCNQLCVGSEYATTPVHVAVTIGVEASKLYACALLMFSYLNLLDSAKVCRMFECSMCSFSSLSTVTLCRWQYKSFGCRHGFKDILHGSP